jgi:peptidyl-prolyl cis-trans isomerase A (cyclophilin A)
MVRLSIRSVCAVILLVFAGVAIADGEGESAVFQPPEGLHTGWYARIETDMGRIIARLLPEQAPQAVAHFAALAAGELEWLDPATGEVRKEHFYDGAKVYKAEAGSHFEVGGQDGTGRGGPQMFIPPEGLRGPADFSGSGRLGMTRSPGSRFSAYQFFVTYAARPAFNRGHPCFGVVVSGKEIVLGISQVKTHSNGRPIEPVHIKSIRIFAVGEPEPLPKPVPYTPEPGGSLQRRYQGSN